MSEKLWKECQSKICLTFFNSVYHLKPFSVYVEAAYRIFPSSGPLLTHVSKNFCSYLSCVSLVHRSNFVFELNLSEMIPPCGFNSPKTILTHVCQNFCGLFLCVRDSDIQKQATNTKLPPFLLALSHF